MADEGHTGADEGGQDLCTFFASFINQRVQVERLLNWLRESQTACTDSNCFDDINGLPGSEHGGSLATSDDGTYYQGENEHGAIAIVMCVILGILTIYAMALNRDRQADDTLPAKSNRSGNGGPPSDDDHSQFRRNNDHDDDNHARPAL